MTFLAVLGAVFLLSTAYLAGFATPSVFYMVNVLLHVGLGILLTVCLAIPVHRRTGWPGTALLVATAGLGWYLIENNTFQTRYVLWAHIAVGCLLLAFLAWRLRLRPSRAVSFASVAVVVTLPLLMSFFWHRADGKARIVNPQEPPLDMKGEGQGPSGPFWPSSVQTNTQGTIPAKFFLDSAVCGECHKEIYEQWNSSMHHFASFNNQFYRKSIEYMQDKNGVQSTKWCAGCHDHALLFSGKFDTPIKQQIDTPEAHAGLGCVSCHAITHVDSTMGNGGFTVEYPELHELAASQNPVVKRLDRWLTFTDPEPHRRTFLKAFMRADSSEFCSTCHKVHLDVPVNNYRWVRGFNDYDNWQASGVSGQGARSFYYPAKSSTCAECHMPLVDSGDPGNKNGKVHSHRFATANTAVATVNEDQRQLEATKAFLQSGFITVDVFAASPAESQAGQTEMRRTRGAPELASTFAVGEEAEGQTPVLIRDVGKLAAPLNRTSTKFQRGSTVRVDVVVRTRKIGHFFPGGTVDAFDAWLEVKAKDARGRELLWSGAVMDGGKGPVEPGAHFYRSFQLDGEGNHINKRNAFETRSLLYVRLIPPGAADVAHYRLAIPKDAEGPIEVEAKLNYRKFAHSYTQFAYESAPKVSGKVKRVPDVPIVELARSSAKLQVSDEAPVWSHLAMKQDRERWNDWGIGLLLQGDLKGAEYGFARVTEAEPGYADGWLNVARALIQEGETDRAKEYLDRAEKLGPGLGRVHYFRALVQKADGDYDGALRSLGRVVEQYPRDRVVQNQVARVLFLKKDFAGAVRAAKNVLAVDPEDVQAHYTLMLSYGALGDSKAAEREQVLFRRFKADESSQAITAVARAQSPEDNNERQAIHEHEGWRAR